MLVLLVIDPPRLRGPSSAPCRPCSRSAARFAAVDGVLGGVLAERSQSDGAVDANELPDERNHRVAPYDHRCGAVRDVRSDPSEERHAGRCVVSATASSIWPGVAVCVCSFGEAFSCEGEKGV